MDDQLEPPPRSIFEFATQWRDWLFRFYKYVKENMNKDFYFEVARGSIKGHTVLHKFGAGTMNAAAAVVSQTGTFQTPTTAVNLEFVSGSAQDGVAGTGAREVKILGLDSNWDDVEYTVTTNGIAPVTQDINGNNISLIRLNRWFVTQSGTYATTSLSSHVGILTLRVSGGGTVWDTIPISPFPLGQSVIGAYSVARKKSAFLMSKTMHIDANQAGDIYFFQRPFADDVTSPYTGARRLIELDIGIKGQYSVEDVVPKGPFVGPCDIGMIGVNGPVGGAAVSVEFELILVDA